MLTGLACTFYVSLGSILSGKRPPNLPLRIDECTDENLKLAGLNMTMPSFLLLRNTSTSATAVADSLPAPEL